MGQVAKGYKSCVGEVHRRGTEEYQAHPRHPPSAYGIVVVLLLQRRAVPPPCTAHLNFAHR